VGSERTLGDLRQGAALVQQAYRDAGYGGVVAYIPEQELAEGTVIIRVVEGKLARVRIVGNQRYDEANIRHSLPSLREGETPRVAAIDRDIQLANENPAKQVQVELTAGDKPTDIDANVALAEADPKRILLTLDNTGTPDTGLYRLSAGVQHANLWNRDHIGTLQYQTSPSEPSLVRIYSAGYRMPLYGYASTIDAYYAHSSVDNGTSVTPAGPLAFTGKGDFAGLHLNRYLPRRGEYDHRVTFGVDWRDYQNQCSLGTFGSAGCGTAGASVTVLPISLAYTGQVQTPQTWWGASAAIGHNVDGSSQAAFDAARPGAKKEYDIFRLSAYAGHNLPAGFGVQARLSGQFSPDALIPGEQFGLGGAESVRGYFERELAGDYGFYVSLEGLGPPLVGRTDKSASVRPLVFFDYGHITNHKDTPCFRTESSCTLSGVGFGLRLTLSRWLAGRLDVAYAIDDSTQTTAGTVRVHFALNAVF
jgi:hemolysin activation/secretion protein